MADSPINLNRARKTRARLDKKTKADENAIRFGLTKAEKKRHELEKQRTENRLSAHFRAADPEDMT